MRVELINMTQFANIYGVYDQTGKPIGQVNVILAGRDCGTQVYTLSGKYNRRDIRKFFNEARKKATTP
jgi:hypothetical protein